MLILILIILISNDITTKNLCVKKGRVNNS